ncbi:MAG: J domain-containing protein [Spirochaetales bacterium]|nr:J domain-containing protein [Spirochaetales bacterium]
MAIVLNRYYKVLDIESGSSMDKIKDAYYRAAKMNHPDLFPEAERHVQQLRMMKINEAYLTIVSQQSRQNTEEKHSGSTAGTSAATSAVFRGSDETEKFLSTLKDPAYTYYKLGFKYYTIGRKTFFDRYQPKDNRYHYMMDNREILMLAISCLKLFEKSYSYFLRVAEEYSDSVWYRDTVTKMHYLERYNAIYQRICMSIADQLEAKNRERED